MSVPNRQILQEMFTGFMSTPLLWQGKNVYGMEQFLPETTNNTVFKDNDYKSLRLGNWAEKFVSFQIKNQSDANIVAENLQIKKEKETIGEIDLLFMLRDQPIHLEIVYKFYLYDTTIANENGLDPWVGPNKRDSLIYKLNKLKAKQFPLLYKDETQSSLDKLALKSDKIKQLTCFKAQLFAPINNQKNDISSLNEKCIMGHYFRFDLLDLFKDHKFFIPTKLEWLCVPRINVEWLDYNEAKSTIDKFINNKRSPLVWLKSKDNRLKKYFITWW